MWKLGLSISTGFLMFDSDILNRDETSEVITFENLNTPKLSPNMSTKVSNSGLVFKQPIGFENAESERQGMTQEPLNNLQWPKSVQVHQVT
jgi:hypothetical protein